MEKVSCIIPAYNESDRITTVLSTVAANPLINEVIVVDDGSGDVKETAQIVKRFPNVRFICHEVNQGKSKALHTGIMNASHEVLLFLDADLVGLVTDDVDKLITPVLSGQVGMTISMRKNSPWIDRQIGIDFISGERVFHRSLLGDRLQEIPKLTKFGFETFLNTIVIEKQCPLMVVYWPQVISPYKVAKRGLIAGVKGEVGMMIDVCSTIPFYMIPHMFYKMRRLMVSPEK